MTDLDFVVVGTPRSGTTLIQRLVMELDGTSMPPETHFFDMVLPFVDKAGWSFPLSLDQVNQTLEAVPLCPPVDTKELDPSSAASLFASLVRTLAAPGQLYGEKTPRHVLWWRPLITTWPNLRLIAVVRHPCAVLASHREVPWGTSDPIELSVRWVHEQSQIRAAAQEHSERVLALRYEDVVHDSGATSLRLARFLGVSASAGRSVDPATLLHGWEPWKGRAAEPVEGSRKDRWRSTLEPEASGTVQALCAAEMRRWNYPVEWFRALVSAARQARSIRQYSTRRRSARNRQRSIDELSLR